MSNEYFYPCQGLELGLKKQPSSISVLIAGPLDKTQVLITEKCQSQTRGEDTLNYKRLLCACPSRGHMSSAETNFASSRKALGHLFSPKQ